MNSQRIHLLYGGLWRVVATAIIFGSHACFFDGLITLRPRRSGQIWCGEAVAPTHHQLDVPSLEVLLWVLASTLSALFALELSEGSAVQVPMAIFHPESLAGNRHSLHSLTAASVLGGTEDSLYATHLISALIAFREEHDSGSFGYQREKVFPELVRVGLIADLHTNSSISRRLDTRTHCESTHTSWRNVGSWTAKFCCGSGWSSACDEWPATICGV